MSGRTGVPSQDDPDRTWARPDFARPDSAQPDSAHPDFTRPDFTRPDFTPPGTQDATQVLSGGERSGPESTVVMPAAGGTTVQPVALPHASAPSASGPSASGPSASGPSSSAASSSVPPTTPSKPRSRTVMIAVIAVLAVLALLIAGDRVANVVAQNTIANALQSELSTPTKPEVSIGGFPFVTQVLGGSFSSVHMTADDATVQDEETAVAVAHLDATLTGITATDRYQNIVASRGEATALVDWASISSLANQQVSYVADDRMRIDFSVPIGRLSIDGYITGRPQLNVDDQTITVAEPQVSVAQVDVPQAVVDAVSRIVLRPFEIGSLPYDISVTDLTLQPDGVSLSGTGQDIPLRGR